MKKAKIVLAAIAVIGIVGGSLAFKAKSAFGGVPYYTTNASGLVAPAGNVLVGAVNATGVFKYYTMIPGAVATHFQPIKVIE